MSAVPRNPGDFGYHGLRMTAEEYLALGETQERYQLVDGVVLMSPSPTNRHNRILTAISGQLFVLEEGGAGLVYYTETDVCLSATTVYQPDLCVYRLEPGSPPPDRLVAPPHLAIEILSPGSKALDLITKLGDYDRFGIAECWVIEPETVAVRVWSRQGGRLVERAPGGVTVESAAVPGLRIDFDAVRRRADRTG